MTVLTTTNRTSEYTANGTTVRFDFLYPVLAATDLQVFRDGVLESTSLYTITLIDKGAGGGYITYTTAPPNGVKIVIVRVLALTQPNDFQNEGNMPEDTIEKSYDRGVMLVQQLNDQLSRTFSLPISASPLPTLTLPWPWTANTILGINSAANAIELKTLSSIGLADLSVYAHKGLVNTFTQANTFSATTTFVEKIEAAKGIRVNVTSVPGSPATGDIWAFNSLLYARGASQTFPVITGNGMAGSILCGLKPTQTSGNVFQFAPGVIIASNGTDSIVFNSAVNVDISVTSGAGYRNPSETRTADTQYYVWAMRNPTTNTNILVWSSNRTTAPTISGFTLSALIPEFAAYNNASNTFENHLIEQWQNGTRIRFEFFQNTFNAASIPYLTPSVGSSAFSGTAWNNLNYGSGSSIAGIIPPIANWAYINGYNDSGSGPVGVIGRKTSSSPEFNFNVGGANGWPVGPYWVPINGASSIQFQIRANAVGEQFRIFPMGWGV